mmetsp:Transcript_32001/g.91847  ORF Transcript_32001/g.91847 Transcript_32001/m.91847 type:complete len:460 (-) Transcript_32001:2222-3601(-)
MRGEAQLCDPGRDVVQQPHVDVTGGLEHHVRGEAGKAVLVPRVEAVPEGVLEPPQGTHLVSPVHGDCRRKLACRLGRPDAHARRLAPLGPLLCQLQLALLGTQADDQIVAQVPVVFRSCGHKALQEFHAVLLCSGEDARDREVVVDLLRLDAGAGHARESLDGALRVPGVRETLDEHPVGVGVRLQAVRLDVLQPRQGGGGRALGLGRGGVGGEDVVVLPDAGPLALRLHALQPLHGALAVARRAALRGGACKLPGVAFAVGGRRQPRGLGLAGAGAPLGGPAACRSTCTSLASRPVGLLPGDGQVLQSLTPVSQGCILSSRLEAVHCRLQGSLDDPPLRHARGEHALQPLVRLPGIPRHGVAARHRRVGPAAGREARGVHGLHPLLRGCFISCCCTAFQHTVVGFHARYERLLEHLIEDDLRSLHVAHSRIAVQDHGVSPHVRLYTLDGHPLQPPVCF